MKPVITHVLFDLDGLLLDTESLYTQSISLFCAKFGKQFTPELKSLMMGRGTAVAGQMLIDALQLPCTVQDYAEETYGWLKTHFPTCECMPGALRLVEHLHSHGVPMCIATGSSEEVFALKTETRHRELIQRFSHVVLTTDKELKNCKPAPDIFELGASRFTAAPASPANCLVFEDAPNGIEAGLAAGMWVVAVPARRIDVDRFLPHPHLIVLDSLNDFKPEDFSLPPFTS